MGRIVWIASFPKSGNTWVRIFLTNYLRGTDVPAQINRLDVDLIASSRQAFDSMAGVESSELTDAEVQDLLPAVYRHLARSRDGLVFVKVHHAFERTPSGAALFPADVTARVIYLLRHPADVAVSLAHHRGLSVASAVRAMSAPAFTLSDSRDGLPEQLPQRVGSWAEHVRSWIASGLPIDVFRYEDLIQDPHRAFAAIVVACGLELDVQRVARAVESSRFDRLKRQEEEGGFAERSPTADTFFRSGRVGDWRSVLTSADARCVIAAHGDVMRQFGYLSQDGRTLLDGLE